MAKTLKGLDAVTAFCNSSKGQVVLVLQGGGALGAYQVGVYQALHEAGIKLDWVIGTSIGAINAGLIAGNTPERRVDALQEFWRRMRSERIWHYLPAWTGLPDVTSYLTTLFGGISASSSQRRRVLGPTPLVGRRTCRVLFHGAVTKDCQRTGRLLAH